MQVGQASIEFDLPAQLAELLYTYLGEARRALLAYHLLNGQSCPYVFMDMHGRGFADAAVDLVLAEVVGLDACVRLLDATAFVGSRQWAADQDTAHVFRAPVI
ncbi:TPA: hypothetical protein ACH3X2_010674 [Trebouxia sp. C0005]